MKCMKRVLCLVLIMVLIVGADTYAFAMENGFITEELSKEEQELFLSNIHICPISAEEKNKPISCFDVNSDGCIVLGFYDTDRKKICVYDKDGVFKYGYSFECSGTFGVEWSDENIEIYFVRSDVAAIFDENAECLEIRKIENNIENNSYWNKVVWASKKSDGSKEYYLRNNMGLLNLFASSYSQLIVINEDGIENIFYNVNNGYLIKLISKFIIIVTMFIIVILSLILRYRSWKRRQIKQQNIFDLK